jgi:hypothetical protein
LLLLKSAADIEAAWMINISYILQGTNEIPRVNYFIYSSYEFMISLKSGLGPSGAGDTPSTNPPAASASLLPAPVFSSFAPPLCTLILIPPPPDGLDEDEVPVPNKSTGN